MMTVIDVKREKAGDLVESGRTVVQCRVGAPAVGLYPEVSRTKLAREMGKHVATVASYLIGRVRPSLDTALILARLIGIEVERLNKDLQEVQGKYKAGRGVRVKVKRRKLRRKAVAL